MTDYHTKPVLAARVRPDNKAWARKEAKRRKQGVGEFLDELLDAERDRAANPPLVAAKGEQPHQSETSSSWESAAEIASRVTRLAEEGKQ